MATEYDLLRSLLSRSERHNQQPSKRFDKYISIRQLLWSLRMVLDSRQARLLQRAANPRAKDPNGLRSVR
jgi:hypothetical protein